LRSARASLRLPFDMRLIEWRLLGDILRVGGLSAIGTIQSNLTVVLVTGAVGLFAPTPSQATESRRGWITSRFRCCSRSAAPRSPWSA